MRYSSFPVFVLFLTSLASVFGHDTRRHRRDDVTGHVPSTHEEILAHRERKKDAFSAKLEEMKQRMDDHKTQRQLLTKDEYYKLERKIKAYENKMEELNRDFDERHSRRLLAREELLNEMTRARMASRDEL
jgi:peptidoglycan hydrolase CwlO-like protein